ncbi:F-box domain protein, partial [Ancylostoma caninum]
MPENGDLLFDFNFEPFDSYEFHRWSELPYVLKIKILQYLPYPTIRRFMFLSKECYLLASNAKMQAKVVRLHEQSYRMEMFNIPGEKNRLDLVVHWMPPDKQLLRNAHKEYRLSFAEDPNGGCYVEKIRSRKGRVSVTRGMHYDEDTYTTAMRVLFCIARFMDILSVEIQ